jgi:anaerobic glycerol-3-phosphate dehydrogenase
MPATMHEIIGTEIRKGKSNAEALAAAKAAHPYSKMSEATVNYIRNQLRKKDKTIKSDRAAKRRK